MNRKFVTIEAVAIAAMLTLAGCSAGSETSTGTKEASAEADKKSSVTNKTDEWAPGEVESFEYELPNGDKVFCIWASASQKAGLWCTPDYDVQR